MVRPQLVGGICCRHADTGPRRTRAEYVIGVGDVLEVVFLYHNNLTTRDLVVRRDGRISLPYVGDQMAAGITPMVLDSMLTTRFSEILREPKPLGNHQDSREAEGLRAGRGRAPGPRRVHRRAHHGAVGGGRRGFKDGALANHAILIRRQGVSKIVGVEVDLNAVVSGALLSNDLRLRNYDIVFIPQHPIYSAAEFMTTLGDIINMPLDIVYKGWQIANLSATYEYFRANQPVQDGR